MFCSKLTLTEGVDGVVAVPEMNDVTMFWLGGDVEQQRGRTAVSVLCLQRLGADGEPQVTRGQNLQSGRTFVYNNLGDAIVDSHDSNLESLRAPSLKNSVGENIKVSVCAIGDSKGERVL